MNSEPNGKKKNPASQLLINYHKQILLAGFQWLHHPFLVKVPFPGEVPTDAAPFGGIKRVPAQGVARTQCQNRTHSNADACFCIGGGQAGEGSSQLLKPEEGDVVRRRVHHRRLQENIEIETRAPRGAYLGSWRWDDVRDRPWRRGPRGRACWRGSVYGAAPPRPGRAPVRRRRRRPSAAGDGGKGPVPGWGGAEWSRCR